MLLIIGFVIVFAAVLGGFMLAGGHPAVLLHVSEFVVIGGVALGILVVAIGRAEFLKGDWVQPGATVIDVGTTRVDDPSRQRGYRLAGDVDFAAARRVA